MREVKVGVEEDIVKKINSIVVKSLGLNPTSTDYNRMIIALEAVKQRIIRRSFRDTSK
jgi:hypothetical protein